jgi:hypothetical protein
LQPIRNGTVRFLKNGINGQHKASGDGGGGEAKISSTH